MNPHQPHFYTEICLVYQLPKFGIFEYGGKLASIWVKNCQKKGDFLFFFLRKLGTRERRKKNLSKLGKEIKFVGNFCSSWGKSKFSSGNPALGNDPTFLSTGCPKTLNTPFFSKCLFLDTRGKIILSVGYLLWKKPDA